MKRAKKLTRTQKIYLSKKGLNPDNWMVKSEDAEIITFIHKTSKKTREYKKPI